MTAKLLVLDVDGTLLRRDGTVDPRDAEAIRRLRASGVPVSIATGRMYSGTHDVARSVGLSGPIACVDGSQIVDLERDETRVRASIAGAAAATLRGIAREHGLTSFLFAEDGIIHDAGGDAFAAYVRTWSPRIDIVASALDHGAWDDARGLLALVGIAEEAAVRGAVRGLEASLGDAARVLSFPVHRIGMHAMLVRAGGHTKGTAVAWLAQHHGVALKDVVVVGDWLNDIPMFEVAGRSFAMDQAPPEVKARATDELVASCFVGGGVAEAIERGFGVLPR